MTCEADVFTYETHVDERIAYFHDSELHRFPAFERNGIEGTLRIEQVEYANDSLFHYFPEGIRTWVEIGDQRLFAVEHE